MATGHTRTGVGLGGLGVSAARRGRGLDLLLHHLFVLQAFLRIVVAELEACGAQLPLQALVSLLAIDMVGGRAGPDSGGRRGHGRGLAEDRVFRGFAQHGVGFSVDVGARLKPDFLLEVGNFVDPVVVARAACFGGGLLLLLNAAVDGGDLLQGIEHLAGGERLKLSGADGVKDISEGVAQGVQVVERVGRETIGPVVAQGAGTTQTADALGEVVITVFLFVKSGRAAVGSVFFDVAASFVLHDGQSSFLKLATSS
jgi:hypothetical protein